jgi:hypothetical protein
MQNEMCRLSGRHVVYSKSAPSSVNTAGSAIELPACAGFLRITQMNMWTAPGRTLARESPHIVGFGRRDTIYRVNNRPSQVASGVRRPGGSAGGCPSVRVDSALVRGALRRIG